MTTHYVIIKAYVGSRGAINPAALAARGAYIRNAGKRAKHYDDTEKPIWAAEYPKGSAIPLPQAAPAKAQVPGNPYKPQVPTPPLNPATGKPRLQAQQPMNWAGQSSHEADKNHFNLLGLKIKADTTPSSTKPVQPPTWGSKDWVKQGQRKQNYLQGANRRDARIAMSAAQMQQARNDANLSNQYEEQINHYSKMTPAEHLKYLADHINEGSAHNHDLWMKEAQLRNLDDYSPQDYEALRLLQKRSKLHHARTDKQYEDDERARMNLRRAVAAATGQPVQGAAGTDPFVSN